MRKRISAIVFILMMSVTANFATGCYGSFTLTKKVYNWNGTMGSKVMKSVVMWGLYIIPVYGIAGVADIFILNTLEFLQGSNPLAMNEGEQDIQIVQKDGKSYQITASKDKFDIVELNSENPHKASLVFDRNSESWSIQTSNENIVIAQMSETNENVLNLIHPDGSTVAVNITNMK